MNKKQPWHFYHTMRYPVPKPQERFASTKQDQSLITDTHASWDTVTTTTKAFADYVDKFKKIYCSLPCITHIYLCNSLSFNAVKETSDIDIAIITKPGRIWTVRFYSVLFFRRYNIKRTKKQSSKRFCLSFYLSHNHCNLYGIKRSHSDHYLAYRVAHLIPLVVYDDNPNHMLDENQRIHAHLPNYPKELTLSLKSHRPYTEPTSIKKFLDKVHQGYIGNILETCIKYLRLPIIWFKKRKLRKPNDIIVSDTMLKFHHDKRDTIHDILKITR